MRTYFDVYAIKLSQENIPNIVEVTSKLGWTLGYLQDNMEYNAEDFGEDTVLFMKIYRGTTEIATFTDQSSDPTVDDSYRLTDEIDPLFGIFNKVEQI